MSVFHGFFDRWYNSHIIENDTMEAVEEDF